MKSRAARLTLLILFVVALGVTAYLFWKGESLVATETASLRAFEANAQTLSRTVLDVRMAQQAYVATGQGGEFWSSKVSGGLSSALAALEALKNASVSPRAITELDAALENFEDFSQLDRRAREYARTGQNLLASDLIFSDGLELMNGASARIDAAEEAETTAREAAVRTFRQRQVFAVAAAAAAAVLVVLLLYPRLQEEPLPALSVGRSPGRSVEPASRAEPAAAQDLEFEAWSPPQPASAPTPQIHEPDGSSPGSGHVVSADAAQVRGPTAELPAAGVPPPPAAPVPVSGDFNGLASLCTDLARVVDTQDLPRLLERASSLLDASGIILWIADPDARELNPIMAQGYPPQLLNRLGALPRDAENATAAAFRTSLMQTVKGDGGSNGAIAAPLVTASGCVGVMAAEVRDEAEQKEGKLAAATIMAAQLATLVGPPPARQGNLEAAGA